MYLILLQLPNCCLTAHQNYCWTNFRCSLVRALHLHASQFFRTSSAFVSLFPCRLRVQHVASPHPGFLLSIFLCCRSFCELSSPAAQASPAAPHCSTFPLQLDLRSSASVSPPSSTGCKCRCCCFRPHFHDLQLCLSRSHQRLRHGSS